MIAFMVAGLIVGVLARVLRHEPDDPSVALTLPVGVVGAVVGGVGMNVMIDEAWTDLNPFSFAAACIVGMVVLGLLEGRVGRR